LKWRWLAAIAGMAAAVLLGLWLARAFIAVEFARNYFRSHGVTADVEIGRLGLSGASGRFALGPSGAPDLSAERIELYFDPLRWIPFVTEVRLVRPVVRAQISGDGQVKLGSLQAWLDSLRRQQGKSRFVSDELVVSLTGLRALLGTPAGAAEMDGNVRLVKNLPVSADLVLRPAQLTWNGMTAQVKAGRLRYDNTGQASAHITADIQGKGLDFQGLDADLKASGLHWSLAPGFSLSTSSASLALSATGFNGVRAAVLNLAIAKFSFDASPMSAVADLRLTGSLSPGPSMPVLHTGDVRLDRALAANLAHLDVKGAGHLALQQGRASISFTSPLEIAGARGGALTLRNLQLGGDADSFSSPGFHAALHGSGLPNVAAEIRDLVWSGGGATAHARLNANFDHAMLRRASLSGDGMFSWQSGRYSFTAASCARIKLAAFHPSTSDLAKDISGDLCGARGTPLLAGEGVHWRLSGQARRAQAFLPLANSQANNVFADLDFQGEGADFHGQARVSGGRISDKTVPVRFKPLLGKGTARLAGGV
jgi:hypothetical protein